MRLRQKIILLIVPVIVLPMIISGWFSYYQLKTTVIEKSLDQMDTLLEQYAIYADSFIHSAESNISLFSNNELLRRYMVTQSEEERYGILQPLLMKQLQNYQKAYPGYYEFRLIFPDGFEDLRQVNRDVENVTMYEAGNPFIKKILAEREGVFSAIQRNPDNDTLALYVAIALHLKDRSIESVTSVPSFRGFLVLTIEISNLIQQAELSRLGADGYLFITNAAGHIEIFPEWLAGNLNGKTLSQEQMSALKVDTTVTDVIGGSGLSGMPIITTRFLDDEGYMKGVRIHEDFILLTWLPVDEISQKTQGLGLIVIGMTLLAVLVTVLLLFGLLNHFVLSPIHKLRNAATEIGRGVLTTDVDMGHDDEVGDLASSFDEMRKNMLRSHENLEKLVDARTAEVRQALKIAENASQAKSNFLSRMSHELRTPLNAILGFSQLYEYEHNLTENQKKNAREINNAGEHLLSLIDEVLDLSKIEAGRLELSRESVSLSKVLENCCLLTKSLAGTHDVSIEYESSQCDELYVFADAMRLKQVFLNLISNAVKYNYEHGKVNIKCTRKSNDVIRVDIRDTGPGIAEDLQLQLFEPFNRLGAEYSGVEGTGIGLLITKQLVELMGGRLGVDSAPGAGSTFWVELYATIMTPTVASIGLTDDRSQITDTDTNTNTGVTEGLRILVAEDNETNQEVLRQQLHMLGYKADFVDNGLDALEQWRSGDYQLLMTDIHMPQMGGYELVGSIRKTRKYTENKIPIIAFTADAMHGQAQRCLEAGMDDYISKPVHMGDLRQKLGKWLAQDADASPGEEYVKQGSQHKADNAIAGTQAPAAIDPAALTQLVGDNPAIHRRLLQTFITTTPDILADVQAAFSKRDADRLVTLAHKLKASARSVGAYALFENCERLEVEAAARQWPEIESLVPALLDLYQLVELYVKDNYTQD